MATLTNNVTLEADDATEYADLLARVNSYEPADGEPDLSDLVEDEPNLTITYTLTKTS